MASNREETLARARKTYSEIGEPITGDSRPPTREYELPQDIVAILSQVDPPGPGEILILPDRVGTDERGPWVAVRSEAQFVRSLAVDAGISARLALPPGYRLREYQEHDASLVLPILETTLTGGSFLAAIVALILGRRAPQGSPDQRVRIRECTTVERDGERVQWVREWDMPVDELANGENAEHAGPPH